MSHPIEVQQLFATPLLTHRPDRELCQAASALADYFIQLSNRNPGLQVTNIGGWHSEHLTGNPLLCLPYMRVIVHRLRDMLVGVQPELASLSNGLLADKLTAWGNVMGPGCHHLTHCHLQAVWSGVFYCQTEPAADARLQLYDPRIPTIEAQHPGQASLPVDQNPPSGQLLLFPAWLRHSVTPLGYSEQPRATAEQAGGQSVPSETTSAVAPRVSLAFNLLA